MRLRRQASGKHCGDTEYHSAVQPRTPHLGDAVYHADGLPQQVGHIRSDADEEGDVLQGDGILRDVQDVPAH